ncbi:MAG: hypothetical protein Q7S74_02275 [Nanoarchaeota archaeon]|nr:hypothetical protein [Nanoarchaeota archaeon]
MNIKINIIFFISIFVGVIILMSSGAFAYYDEWNECPTCHQLDGRWICVLNHNDLYPHGIDCITLWAYHLDIFGGWWEEFYCDESPADKHDGWLWGAWCRIADYRCSTVGATQCVPSAGSLAYQTCLNVGGVVDGVFDWSTVNFCGSGQTCSNGACENINTCTNECSSGQIKCNSETTHQDCFYNSATGCYSWRDLGSCANGCDYGTGTCRPECGGIGGCPNRCNGNLIETNGVCIATNTCQYTSPAQSCTYQCNPSTVSCCGAAGQACCSGNSCTSGYTCDGVTCQISGGGCIPDCAGKSCGGDGCGGSCGSCGGSYCSNTVVITPYCTGTSCSTTQSDCGAVGCSGGACNPCGSVGKICCSGDTCPISGICQGGSCVTPPAFDFSLANTGNVTVVSGSSVLSNITATFVSGTASAISFSASGLPSGANPIFTPTSCTPSPVSCNTTLNISTILSTNSGDYNLIISGIGGGTTRTTKFNLTIPCGVADGSSCCAGDICLSNDLACNTDINECESCGGVGEICCSVGNQCDSGLECNIVDNSCTVIPPSLCKTTYKDSAITVKQIQSCMNYNNVSDYESGRNSSQECNNDCVKPTSVGGGRTLDAAYSTCSWQTETNKCLIIKNIVVAGSITSCVFNYEQVINCSDDQDYTIVNYTVAPLNWIGDPDNSSNVCRDQTECGKGRCAKQVLCPKPVKLPFFTWINLVSAIIIIAVIYIVFSSNREKKKRYREKKKRYREGRRKN